MTNCKLLEDLVREYLALICSGKLSVIFTNRNEQLIKELIVKDGGGWEEWINFIRNATEYEHEVCFPRTTKLLIELISKLKPNRAPGVDGITSSMLLHASPLALQLLTSLFNEMLFQGLTPESLNVCKMTLVDKKQSSLSVNGKCPFTVSSIILNLFKRLFIHAWTRSARKKTFMGISRVVLGKVDSLLIAFSSFWQ